MVPAAGGLLLRGASSNIIKSMGDEAKQEEGDWAHAALESVSRRMRAAVPGADRFALIREMTRLSNGRLPADKVGADWGQDGPVAARFGIHVTSNGRGLRSSDYIVLEQIDPHLPAAMRLATSMRAIGRRTPPDAYLLRFSPHKEYRTETQRTASRALASMPPGGTLMVSMPTGAGKSLLFQIMAVQARDGDPHAAVAVIVPTVALALDHARTLRSYPGLEASRALVGSMNAGERNAVRDAFRRGEVPILLLSPEAALGYAREALIEAATPRESKSLLLPCRLDGVTGRLGT
jgi:ATP-dependent DNA helicase RecQ